MSLPSTLDSACGVGSNSRKDIGESVFAGLDDGARLVCDQPARHGIGVLGVAQVPCAIELVQAGGGEAGGVADVVQPRGGFQQISVRAENSRQAVCPRGNSLDVRPPAGEALMEKRLSEMSSP